MGALQGTTSLEHVTAAEQEQPPFDDNVFMIKDRLVPQFVQYRTA